MTRRALAYQGSRRNRTASTSTTRDQLKATIGAAADSAPPRGTTSPGAHHGLPLRWSRALRRLVIAGVTLAAAVTALFTAGALYLVTLPGVGDAQKRVDRILAAHHTPIAAPCRRPGLATPSLPSRTSTFTPTSSSTFSMAPAAPRSPPCRPARTPAAARSRSSSPNSYTVTGAVSLPRCARSGSASSSRSTTRKCAFSTCT